MLKIESEQEHDGRWVAEVPALPGAFVYGYTKAAARPGQPLPREFGALFEAA